MLVKIRNIHFSIVGLEDDNDILRGTEQRAVLKCEAVLHANQRHYVDGNDSGSRNSGNL